MNDIETQVRDFGRQFGHLANVRRMIALCETGVITWADAYVIARQALSAGLQAVQS